MFDVPVALAIGAGMLATVNPCGFALLPAYLGFFVGREGDERRDRLTRALVVSGVMTAGFVTVFGAAGLLVQTVAQGLDEHLTKATMVVGAALVVLGLWLLSGRELRLAPHGAGRAGRGRGLGSMYLFGVSYAAVSLSCTLGPFLVVLTPTFRASGTAAGIAAFLWYALGMGLVVGTVTMAVAGARAALVARLRRAGRYVNRASGALLVIAGLYIVWYGRWENRGDFASDPVVDRAQAVRGWLAARVDALSPALLAALVAVVGGLALLRRVRAAQGARGERDGPPGARTVGSDPAGPHPGERSQESVP